MTVGFDPKAVPKPTISSEPPAAGSLPTLVFRRSGEEIRAAAARDREGFDAWRAKVESGRKRAERLTKRFAPWYFVVPGEDYRSILLDRASLVHAKPPAGAPGPGRRVPRSGFSSAASRPKTSGI